MAKPIGYFSKVIDGEGHVMPAYAEADKVSYIYNGWRDVTGEIEAAQAAVKDLAKDDAPAGGKASSAKSKTASS